MSLIYPVLEIDGPTFTNTADGNFQVDCSATGYPAPVMVTLSPDTGSSGSSSRTPAAGDLFQMIREVDLTFPACNSATTLICMATAGSSQSKNMRAIPVCCKLCLFAELNVTPGVCNHWTGLDWTGLDWTGI